MLSFLCSLLIDCFRKPKPTYYHGLEKSSFQRRVEQQLNECCLCGGTGHNSTSCPWQNKDPASG